MNKDYVLLKCKRCENETLFNHPDNYIPYIRGGWRDVFSHWFGEMKLNITKETIKDYGTVKDKKRDLVAYRGSYLCARCKKMVNKLSE